MHIICIKMKLIWGKTKICGKKLEVEGTQQLKKKNLF